MPTQPKPTDVLEWTTDPTWQTDANIKKPPSTRFETGWNKFGGALVRQFFNWWWRLTGLWMVYLNSAIVPRHADVADFLAKTDVTPVGAPAIIEEADGIAFETMWSTNLLVNPTNTGWVRAMCCTEEWVAALYLVASGPAVNVLRIYNALTGAEASYSPLLTVGAATLLCTDGAHLYVANDSQLLKIDLGDGSTLSTKTFADSGSFNNDAIATDGDRVFITRYASAAPAPSKVEAYPCTDLNTSAVWTTFDNENQRHWRSIAVHPQGVLIGSEDNTTHRLKCLAKSDGTILHADIGPDAEVTCVGSDGIYVYFGTDQALYRTTWRIRNPSYADEWETVLTDKPLAVACDWNHVHVVMEDDGANPATNAVYVLGKHAKVPAHYYGGTSYSNGQAVLLTATNGHQVFFAGEPINDPFIGDWDVVSFRLPTGPIQVTRRAATDPTRRFTNLRFSPSTT